MTHTWCVFTAVLFFFWYISHIIRLIPQQQSVEPINSDSAEALAVARRPKEASFFCFLLVFQASFDASFRCSSSSRSLFMSIRSGTFFLSMAARGVCVFRLRLLCVSFDGGIFYFYFRRLSTRRFVVVVDVVACL